MLKVNPRNIQYGHKIASEHDIGVKNEFFNYMVNLDLDYFWIDIFHAFQCC